MTWLIVAWAVVAAGFTWVAVFRLARRTPPKSTPLGGEWPQVLLLRPVDAPTPLELETLAAPIDYPGVVRHVVLSPFRPRLEGTGVEWLPSDPLAQNRKVGHLQYGLSTLAPGDEVAVVCVDADVKVDGALLRALVEALSGGAALATAAPRPEALDTWAARSVRGLLVQSHHSFEALDAMSVGARAVCGKAIALSPEARAALVELHDCIGEDLELSQLLHARGLPVVLAAAPAVVPQAASMGVGSVVDRFTRWMQVLRAHRPSLFPTVPLLFAATPVLLALAVWLVNPVVTVAVGVLVAGRLALAHRLDGRGGVRLEWLLAELLLWGCWLEALRRGRVVTWRGRRFSLVKGGRMVVDPVPLEGGLT